MPNNFEDCHPVAKHNLIMKKETSTYLDVMPLTMMIMYLLATF